MRCPAEGAVDRCQATDSPINQWNGEVVGDERKTTLFGSRFASLTGTRRPRLHAHHGNHMVEIVGRAKGVERTLTDATFGRLTLLGCIDCAK